MRDDSPVSKVSLKSMKIQRTNLTSLENHNRNEVLCITRYPNPVFDEMWFLAVDPFVGISVFIAKLSKRQYCWRVFEDFHCQEYIQFFDVHRCLFMRLHCSVGGYDYRRTARFVEVSTSASLKSFLLIMCIDAPESTT